MQLNQNNAATAPDFNNKRIGIWGYGITGAAAVDYFKSHHVHSIMVLNDTPLPAHTYQALQAQNISVCQPDDKTIFFEQSDYILKSPGIAVHDVSAECRAKIISEFDLFACLWTKPIVAITGTVGKTTVTSVLTQLLCNLGKQAVAGGNIGTPMLNLLAQQSSSDYAIIELSSFHTEHGISQPPDIVIITNVYPNHLDRHGSLENYRNAKLELLYAQKKSGRALLPLSLAQHINKRSAHQLYAWFCLTQPSISDRTYCSADDTFYYNEHDNIICEHKQQKTVIGNAPLTMITFRENILILIAALHQLGIPMHAEAWETITVPAHRLEPVATHNSIVFYNDSKSTIPAATLAALEQLSPHKPVVFLGGVSKGVNRESFIKDLAGRIRMALCFGKEAEQLTEWCTQHGIISYADATLDEAYHRYLHAHAIANDRVLFSPAGASYDLFKNYVERGEHFVRLVHEAIASCSDLAR